MIICGSLRCVLAALATATLAGGAGSAALAEGRVRPPSALECPRDHLTLYSGQVRDYRRGAGRTELEIDTDWDTREQVAIEHPRGEDPSAWFLIEGAAFTAADWGRIEERPGRLRARMRAAAWVCDDGRNPVVDWQPPREP